MTVAGTEQIHRIPLDQIDVVDRLRVVDPAHVAAIAESIRDIGQSQPIEVRKAPGSEKLLRDRYILVSGAHRIEAVRDLGYLDIEARIVVATDTEARLREIDENLARHDLNPLDRAASYALRKEYYEKLYPGAVQGAAGLQAIEKGQTAKIAVWSSVLSFAAATARSTGRAERTVWRAVQMYDRLAPAVRARIAGTSIARQEGELFRLSRLTAEEQAQAVDLMLTEGGPRKVADAAAAIRGQRDNQPDADKSSRAAEREVTRLATWLRRAPKRVRNMFFALIRDEFVAWLAERDQPEEDA
ncbi:ParB N-terminal domain-containing protein [Thalassobaculum sp. OXR-137]|uniref:ParB N-terminal domain-containing protein n=1 Tax=Thalassobaculum sp. OXR-137 TaxID=3100173 RepID=UPI002AC8C583|nr:ParB N-terminal domain-containing protein [Thalassobaculum sp. OXR-137]WPZ33191.1 ParB N-terminal domain-containing protein [Thalassobaculum sp. OXR-137]WPZ34915.1 ParB N-terminal domain-containing protein [Thalassobaculum sp. OXR-137]